jgi:hypothetical protein
VAQLKLANLSAWLYAVYIYIYTGRFIMFFVITNIYNKKTKGPTLMELFTATGKLKKFFFLTMFDMCTTGDTAHIDTIFKLLPNTRQHGCIDILHCCNDSVNCLYSTRMVFSLGECLAYFAGNARCTVTRELLVWYSNTQNYFSPGAAILSLHTFASPNGRNVTYDENRRRVGGNFWVAPSICTSFVNTCPAVFL